jgi:plastocyanin
MNLHLALPALVVGLLAAVVLAGCGSISDSYGSDSGSGGGPYGSGGAASPSPTTSAGSGAQTPASGSTVSIQGFAFTPQTLTVVAGTKVTWTNDESTAHDVTSTDGPGIDAATTDLFASGTLGQGDSFSYTFAEPGTYHYECTIHASMQTMHATVVVE